MTVADAPFDRESELKGWVYDSINAFLGNCILLIGFRITTDP